MTYSIFSQEPHRCRLAWGRRGARDAAARGDIVVIVDVLSFASCVATAIAQGGLVYPAATDEEARAIAAASSCEIAVARPDVPSRGRYSLSPLTFATMEPGARVVLTSPNGAACARLAADSPLVYAGCLLNAGAIAAALTNLLDVGAQCVTLVPCGERWATPSEDGVLRVAVEDALGAGAILAQIRHEKSAEARVVEGAFLSLRGDLRDVLRDCASGRELRERGFGDDVAHASQLDLYDAVPLLRGDHFGSVESFGGETGARSLAGLL